MFALPAVVVISTLDVIELARIFAVTLALPVMLVSPKNELLAVKLPVMFALPPMIASVVMFATFALM